MRYQYVEPEGMLLADVINSKQYDISSANSVLLRTHIMMTPNGKCLNPTTEMSGFIPTLATTAAGVDSNRARLNTVIPFEHGQIICNGLSFPGCNVWDNASVPDLYAY